MKIQEEAWKYHYRFVASLAIGFCGQTDHSVDHERQTPRIFDLS